MALRYIGALYNKNGHILDHTASHRTESAAKAEAFRMAWHHPDAKRVHISEGSGDKWVTIFTDEKD